MVYKCILYKVYFPALFFVVVYQRSCLEQRDPPSIARVTSSQALSLYKYSLNIEGKATYYYRVSSNSIACLDSVSCP